MTKELFRDLAQIYQQKAMESLNEEDLAHAKRYRIAAETEARVAELEAALVEAREALDTCEWYSPGSCWMLDADKIEQALAKIDEVLKK